MRKSFLSIPLFFVLCLNMLAQSMDNDQLEKIFYVVSDSLAGEPGLWQFSVGEVTMLCVTDQGHDRMRIISAVRDMKDVSKEEIDAALEANFHSALDVRYAVSKDVMWVAFIHPLKALHKEQVIDAVSQVYNAVMTFGTTYSSSELSFPKPQAKQRQDKKDLKTKKT